MPYTEFMIIGAVRKALIGVHDDENVAPSIFGFGGIVTAKQVREAILGRPDNDHIQLRPTTCDPRIDVCRLDELPKPFVGC